jgi:TetR/AcrR family transcriptional regulator, lmrAB and yxaGH operons repressor
MRLKWGMPIVKNHQDALLATAVKRFREQGYHGTGLAQLLSESGSPKGSFYHHFPGGKEQLAAAAVTKAAEGIALMVSAVIAKSHTATGAVKEFSVGLAHWFAQSGYRAGCPITSVLLDVAPDGVVATEACQQAFDSWIAIWTQCFEKPGLTNQNANALAQMWVCSLEGAWILSRAKQSKSPIVGVGETFSLLLEHSIANSAQAKKVRR